MLFFELCQYLEKISLTSQKIAIIEILSQVLYKSDQKEVGPLIYLLSGGVGPEYLGKNFNFASKQMSKTLETLFKNDTEKDFFRLQLKTLGDIGRALEISLKEFQDKQSSNQTILFTHQILKKLVETSGEGSAALRSEVVRNFCQLLSPIEAKYFVSIILGQLRLGFSEMTLLSSIALAWGSSSQVKNTKQLFEQAYNRCSDMGFLAQVALEKGIDGIKEIKTIAGVPIRMASAEAMESVEEIVQKIGQSFIVEPKLDGMRVQVHSWMDSSDIRQVRLFSRNLLDISNMFPEIIAYFSKINGSCIVEGEAIAYEEETGRLLSFQETSQRRRKNSVLESTVELPIKFFLFDVLFFDGREVLDVPFFERRKILEQIVDQNNLTIVSSVEEVSISSQDSALVLSDYFETCISKGFEGVMVKKIDGHYSPGKRGYNWIKLKRIEGSGVADTIDCVVLGWYFGQGRRAHFGIGALLVGIYDQSLDKFVSVARVGSGLGDKDWYDLGQELKIFETTVKPSNYLVSKDLEPDQWVLPKCVFSVRADLISRSNVHTAGKDAFGFGLSLRFPRIVDRRLDKNEYQTTDLAFLKQMFDKKLDKN